MSRYPKAYLRIDPNIDQVRPDLDRFVRLLCAANRQPERGWFRDRTVARMVLGKTALTHHERRGDLVPMPDGRLYVDGWEDWQEGDINVGERMRRLRNRKRNGAVTPTVTDTVTPPVTLTATTTVTAPSPNRISPSETFRRSDVMGDSLEGYTAEVLVQDPGAPVPPEPGDRSPDSIEEDETEPDWGKVLSA